MKNGKKYILRIAVAMMCAAMAVSALPAAAFAGDATPGFTQSEEENTGVYGGITWTIGNDGTLTISPAENPEEGYVKGVMKSLCTATDEETGTGDFKQYPWYNKSFTKIVVADGVTSIAAKAFITNANVTEVVIGKDVSEIGAGAFGQLASCTGFTVAEGNTNFTAADGVLYSADMSKLYYYPAGKEGTSFEIPDSVTLLGYNAIFGTKLTSITFAESDKDLTFGYGCLANNLQVPELVLPARTVEIVSNIFTNWTKEQTVYFPNISTYDMVNGKNPNCHAQLMVQDSVSYTENGCTYLCINGEATLTNYDGSDSKVDIPETVEVGGKTYTVVEIRNGAFGCFTAEDRERFKNLEEVTIPKTVTYIQSSAFIGHETPGQATNHLTKVTILGDTVEIGAYAFARNSALVIDMSNVENLTATSDTYHSHFSNISEIYVKDKAMANQVVELISGSAKIYIYPKNDAYSPVWTTKATGNPPTFTAQIPATRDLILSYGNGSSDKIITVKPNGVYPLSEEPDPTRPGYTFDGWYNGDTKVEDESLTVSEDVILTAHWTANAYTIKFDANGGTGTAPADVSAAYDADVTLPENTFTNGDKIFIGWATSADGKAVYADKASVKNLAESGTVTLYAVWATKSAPITPATPVIPSEPTVTPSVSNGWKDLSQGTVYYKNGVKLKGWQTIDGETYYFDQKGVLQTGWLELDGRWYRLDSTGALQTGWVKVGNAWYFMEENGVMKSATWLSDGGKWYYLGADGAMYANRWRCTKGVWYYLLGNGEMAKNRWVEDKGNWYYLGADGGMLVDTTTPDGYKVDGNGAWIKK